MADPITAASTRFLQFRIQWASIALVYYDYSLTFSDEVRYIWSSKFRLSTILYMFCRYALVANVLYLANIANLLGSGRADVLKFISAISVMGRFAVIATFTARTYAVYGRDWRVLALLGSIGALCVACDITATVGLQGENTANVILSIGMCIFEGLSAVLTAFRSIKMLRAGRKPWMSQQESFAFLVFKQSLTYFSLVSIFAIAAVALNFHAPRGSFFQRLPNAFTLPVSCTLTARFLLSLRDWEQNSIRGDGKVATQTVSGFQFAAGPGRGRGEEESWDESTEGQIETQGGIERGGEGRGISRLLSDFGDDVKVPATRRRDEEEVVVAMGMEEMGKGKGKAVEMSTGSVGEQGSPI